MKEKVAGQAKALWQFVFQAIGMLGMVIGAGGVEQLATLTLGQWIMVAMWMGAAYGLTYSIPNGRPPVVLGGAAEVPLGFSPR